MAVKRPKLKMELEATKEYIKQLLDYQYDLLYVRDWGDNHAEFLFKQTTRVIIENELVKSWIIKLVEHTLFNFNKIDTGPSTKIRPDRFVPIEFIGYLVHKTRWPEFSKLADKIENSDADTWKTNLITKSSQMLKEALSDTWEDREFYEEFTGKNDWIRN